MRVEQFHVPMMSCHHCAQAITSELKALSGVEEVRIDMGSKVVEIEHNEMLATETLIAAINEAGYDEVTVVT